METKVLEDEKKKTKKDGLVINGHLKIIEGLRQAKTRDGHSPKSSASSPSSSTSYVMKITMGNCVFSDDSSIQKSKNTKKMENLNKNKKENPKQNREEITNVHKMKNKVLWDCESTLYDSFELNSFNRQLDSAISSSARSISMPHLPPPSARTKQPSSNKISSSLQRLIKGVFRQKQSNTPFKACYDVVDMDKYYVVFDNTGSLTTIPESGESRELVGSKINSLVRKTVSERFWSSRLVGRTCS